MSGIETQNTSKDKETEMEKGMEKKKYRNPLSRHILVGCLSFIVLLCVTMGLIGFLVFQNSMMAQYEAHIRDIMQLTLARIDVEDLECCIQSGEPSQAYQELIDFMDQARQNYAMEYLVIVTPIKEGEHYDVIQVASGLMPKERAGQNLKDIAVPLLGDRIGAFYPPEFIPVIYEDMLHRQDMKFSVSSTEFGRTYDGAMSIRRADGTAIALLTAGVTLAEIDRTMRNYLFITALLGVAISTLFLSFMMFWLRHRIIRPLQQIEAAAGEFAAGSHAQRDPEALVLKRPDIHTGDELESLTDTLYTMSQDMRDYVKRLLSSEKRIEGMEQEITHMNRIAYKDALTGAKNKAAYDKAKNRLNWEILNNIAEFGLLMVDLNHLKYVNDSFGHEKGDVYITESCRMICEAFAASPVYRIGGDEFVILLEGEELRNAQPLLAALRARLAQARSDKTLEEWRRVSAAMGLAVYDAAMDEGADDVFKRADKAMYEEKKAMKAVRV